MTSCSLAVSCQRFKRTCRFYVSSGWNGTSLTWILEKKFSPITYLQLKRRHILEYSNVHTAVRTSNFTNSQRLWKQGRQKSMSTQSGSSNRNLKARKNKELVHLFRSITLQFVTSQWRSLKWQKVRTCYTEWTFSKLSWLNQSNISENMHTWKSFMFFENCQQ